ncbi:hypothetical protein [Bifidobacterium commune]|uniref:hypothetical protein n=1 Tax=Bifidobacterium commune TaxID=1505727 RepID=UPI000A541C29|nr:hypothetical protein [Bifidobacterium commune]
MGNYSNPHSNATGSATPEKTKQEGTTPATPGQGRTFHFLPVHYLSIIRKSKIVARPSSSKRRATFAVPDLSVS